MSHAQEEARAVAILGRWSGGLLALDEAIAELADADCMAALAAMIAERLHVRPEMVLRALDAESDESISVLCRAAGFRINGYSALLRMRRRRHRGADHAPSHALMFFSDLSRVTAEKLVARLAAELGEKA